MSLKSLSRTVEAQLVAMSGEQRKQSIDVIRWIVLGYRAAFKVLPNELLTAVGLGAVEFIVKQKLGANVEKMIAEVAAAAPSLERLILQLRQEMVEHADHGMELRPEPAALREQGGGALLGPAPAEPRQLAAAAEPTFAPGITRRAGG